jgi:hypothetical protein
MLRDDLRYSWRMLRATPLTAAAVILSIALAGGATTAVFGVFNALILRPLPFRAPDRLVRVAERNDHLNLPTFTTGPISAPGSNCARRSSRSPRSAMPSTT